MYIYINIIDTKARLPQSLRCIGDWERPWHNPCLTRAAPGETGVLLSLSIYILISEITMTLNFFSGLINVFTAKNTKEKDFELWAKTEYRNDWQYAYLHMLKTGAGPRMYKELERTGNR